MFLILPKKSCRYLPETKRQIWKSTREFRCRTVKETVKGSRYSSSVGYGVGTYVPKVGVGLQDNVLGGPQTLGPNTTRDVASLEFHY